ncbi:MAG: GYD domain-containing protein [Burkholderiaceae bacterium]|jgi:uncharacterized protein with GYD domain|nr:GYD domain-containing protein [Burkholderiaceae bacterium]GIL06893.1 MAG: hypothetical protein BroJett031_34130 [Betaproteobacteria bacterium]
MATYLMFGHYSSEGIKGISAKRTDKAAAVLRRLGGEMKAGYALLGDVDLVLVVDLPDNEAAMRASVELGKLTGIGFSTAPAITVKEFDRLFAK